MEEIGIFECLYTTQIQFKVDVCITLKVIETHSIIIQTTRLQKLKIHMIKQNMRKQREIVLKII